MNSDCSECAEALKLRRGKKILQRFSKIRQGRPLLYTIFTLPAKLRNKFKNRNDWRNLVKKLIGVMKKDFGFDVGVEGTHPISEDSPDVFHPHVNLVWLQKPGQKPFLDLAKLRQVWGELLQYGGVVDVWHAYSGTKKKNRGKSWERHICRYTARPFPQFSTWKGPVRWYGKLVKVVIETGFCLCCHEPFHFMRFLTESEYLELQKQTREVIWETFNRGSPELEEVPF